MAPPKVEDTATSGGKRLAVAVLGGIVGVWLATWFLPYAFNGSLEKAGQSGDLFGSLNALFSGLAFAGLIIALRMQREELALQRQELRHTREEFAKQTMIHDAHLALLTLERDEKEKSNKLAFEPFLMLRIGEAYCNQGVFKLINAGATIFDLEFSDPRFSGLQVIDFKASADTILDRGGYLNITWEVDRNIPKNSVVSFKISFTTGLKERKTAELSFKLGEEHLESRPPPILF
jgi:hypothetical protein